MENPGLTFNHRPVTMGAMPARRIIALLFIALVVNASLVSALPQTARAAGFDTPAEMVLHKSPAFSDGRLVADCQSLAIPGCSACGEASEVIHRAFSTASPLPTASENDNRAVRLILLLLGGLIVLTLVMVIVVIKVWQKFKRLG
jgi:hypothetical protein